ncbi:MAG: DUF6986 family protein, partial [Polyangiales bacterium]
MSLEFEAILRDLATRDVVVPARVTSAPQPSHTVYGGAHLFKAGGARRLGELAVASLDEHLGDAQTFGALFGLDAPLAARVLPRLRDKLAREPVEDQRIDFEDGFGVRSDDEEDAACDAAAAELAQGARDRSLPARIGVRIKSLSRESRARSLRTLDRFFDLYFQREMMLPSSFVVTLPKVSSAHEVEALARALDIVERRPGIATGTIGIELMVETP